MTSLVHALHPLVHVEALGLERRAIEPVGKHVRLHVHVRCLQVDLEHRHELLEGDIVEIDALEEVDVIGVLRVRRPVGVPGRRKQGLHAATARVVLS